MSEQWEQEYASSPRRWSGRVNEAVAETVSRLTPGAGARALDLGCGEGGDAVWLAGHGWQVSAVDIAPSALARGAEAARARGVAERITWLRQDLATWTTQEAFDLVTASFLHSTADLPRTEILRRAAARVRRGGHLLIVSHVFESEQDVPPWARHHHHGGGESTLLTPAQEVAELDLGQDRWQVLVQEVRRREATGPDGRQRASVTDGVVLMRRA